VFGWYELGVDDGDGTGVADGAGVAVVAGVALSWAARLQEATSMGIVSSAARRRGAGLKFRAIVSDA
jgi:hypothetical protein